MLKNLFGPTKSILCPYCLAGIHFREKDKVTKCPNTIDKRGCGTELPPKYVSKFDQIPPCFTQLIGWSQVGKTVYLQALTAVLMKMGITWKDDYAHSAQTEATLRYTRNVNAFMSGDKMPPATQLQLQEAYIMQLENMPRWGGRTLVMRDVAGEHFNDLKFPVEQTPYLIHVPTALMMISINDLRTQNFTMDQLMNSYIQTLMRNDPKYGQTKRNVIVVLSKADLIYRELPTKIQTYLSTDPISKNFVSPAGALLLAGPAMEMYVREMALISDELRQWLQSVDGGSNLMALAKNEGINLRFSIVSSTGSQVDENNRMTVAISPTRVQDPFFWALEFQSRPARAA